MFGERLASLRKSKGLSQYALAERLNFSRGQLANYEQGKREPDYNTLQKIADFFDVSVDYLIGRTDKPKPIEDQHEDNPISIAFRDGGESLTPEEEEYLQQQLEIFREMRKKFQKNKN